MSDFYVKVGDVVHFSKTVSESDVYLFAGITGDFAPNHVNHAVMEKSSYRQRIAHGALMVGFMSTASTLSIAHVIHQDNLDDFPVSAGYDKVRFIKPVKFGDTITVHYLVASVDRENGKSVAKVECKNQRNEVVAAAEHIMRWAKKLSVKAA